MSAHSVFISHASEDRAAAQELCDALEGLGIRCWIAPRNVRAGKLYAEEILSAIRDCGVVILLLSDSVNQSRHVIQEIDRAFNQGRDILILRIEDVEARGALEYYLSGKQWLDAFPLPLASYIRRVYEHAASLLGVDARQAPIAEDSSPPGRAHLIETDGHRFCLPWSSAGGAVARIPNAAVMFTDVPHVRSDDLSDVMDACRRSGKALVVVAPDLDPSTVAYLRPPSGLAIEARGLDGQPIADLMSDLSVHVGGQVLRRELGFGLPVRSNRLGIKTSRISFLDLPVANVTMADLGAARTVSAGAHNVCFEIDTASKKRKEYLDELKYQVKHGARSRAEFEGLIARLGRFGVEVNIPEFILKPVSFSIQVDQANKVGTATLPAGFASRFFATEVIPNRCVYEGKVRTLVTTIPLHDREYLFQVLEDVAAEDSSLVIFAPEIRGEALALLVQNKLRGKVRAVGVEIRDADQLTAIAHFTRAECIFEKQTNVLRSDSVRSALGTIACIIADAHATTLRK